MVWGVVKRILFKEKGWRIAEEGDHFPYVEHLDCCGVAPSPWQDQREAVYPTYIELNCCFWCGDKMPEFINNMRIFMAWQSMARRN